MASFLEFDFTKKDTVAVISQLTFVCLQSAIVTLEKGMKYVQS